MLALPLVPGQKMKLIFKKATHEIALMIDGVWRQYFNTFMDIYFPALLTLETPPLCVER